MVQEGLVEFLAHDEAVVGVVFVCRRRFGEDCDTAVAAVDRKVDRTGVFTRALADNADFFDELSIAVEYKYLIVKPTLKDIYQTVCFDDFDMALYGALLVVVKMDPLLNGINLCDGCGFIGIGEYDRMVADFGSGARCNKHRGQK